MRLDSRSASAAVAAAEHLGHLLLVASAAVAAAEHLGRLLLVPRQCGSLAPSSLLLVRLASRCRSCRDS